MEALPSRCSKCYKWFTHASDTRRFRLNWFAITIANTLAGLGDFLTTSSLHQFVTSSTEPAENGVRPGLGLSEIWYASIVGVLSLGQFVGAVLVGVLSRYIYTKYLMVCSLGLTAIGGIFYGIGSYGWMILIGRFLIGFYQGAHMTVYRTYIGETSETLVSRLPKEKQAKSTTKYTMITIAFSVGTFGVAMGPVLTAIVAQFPTIDQYRWPGWFTFVHAVVLIVIVVCFMHEKWTDLKRASPGKRNCKQVVPQRLPQIPVQPIILAWFIMAGLVPMWGLTVIESQENPILSDNFGLGIKYTSYVFIFTVVCDVTGVAAMLILSKCHVDNRITYTLGAVLLVIGAILIGDWQAIRGDPCNQLSGNLAIKDSSNELTGCSATSNVTIEFLEYITISQTSTQVNRVVGEPSLASVVVNSCTKECSSVDKHSFCEQLSNLSKECSIVTGSLVCASLSKPTAAPNENGSSVYFCLWTERDMFMNVVVADERALSWKQAGGVHEFSGDGDLMCNYTIPSDGAENKNEFVIMRTSCDTETCEICRECNGQRNCTSDLCRLGEENNVNLTSCILLDSTNSSNQTRCVCQAFSSVPGYSCFWNQVSRITGEYCETCPPMCLSETHSLTFVQLIIGLLFLVPTYPIGRLSLTFMMSDTVGDKSQGLMMAILVGVGAIARATGPLWANPVYVAMSRRTWLLVTIIVTLQLIVLAWFFLLCQRIKRPQKETPDSHTDTVSFKPTEDTVHLLKYEQTLAADDHDEDSEYLEDRFNDVEEKEQAYKEQKKEEEKEEEEEKLLPS